MTDSIPALTLHPEWAWAITHLGKRVENRSERFARVPDLTPEQAEVLLHTLGLSEPGSSSTRNLFVSGKGDPRLADLEALVAAGLMRETRRPGFLAEEDRVFKATDAGLAHALAIQPKPPKLTRSQERYRRWQDLDSNLPFADFLRWRMYEVNRG